jgi:uncharacterized membrane protein SpoIIM required for sporulation
LTLESFLRDRGPSWDELDTLLRQARGRPERLGAEGVLRLGELYRGAAADLAMSRRRFPTDPVRERLERLVRSAALALYGNRSRRGSIAELFARDYWRAIAERPVPLAIAALCLLGPAVLAGAWAGANPDAAASFIPEAFQGATDPPSDSGADSAQRAVFSAELFTNNIQVTFVAFAAGIAAGVGTAFVLAFNGILLGAVAGAAIEAGNGASFLEFVIPHGPLELSCIVVTAAAGLRLGWSFVEPGDRSRGDALRAEGRRAIVIVLGTAPWLVAAGIVEAFVRSAGLPSALLIAVGTGLFVAFWGLIWVLGRAAGTRTPDASEPSRAGVRAAPAT